MTQALTFPDEWLVDIEDALAHPEKFRFAGYDDSDKGGGNKELKAQFAVVPAFLREQYDQFHTRAISHAVTKGEHEAAALINFYVILKYRLWRAEFDTRWDYLQYVTNQPFAISETKVNHFAADIDKLLERGMEVRVIIESLGMAKGATARLASLPDDKLPGGDINRAGEIISSLSPAEAHRYIDDIEQKDVTAGISGIHDSVNNRFILEVLVTHPMPQGAKDPSKDRHYITCLDCPKEVALWLCEKTHVRKERREFR